jgi:hypothetical protein
MNINNKFLFCVTVFIAFFLFAACTNRTPGINPKCKSIAYPEDKHTVCNSFEYYGNKTWTLDSAFYNGQDITDSVMKMVGGYYTMHFDDAAYSMQKKGYLNYGYVELGLGYRWGIWNFPTLTHESDLFFTMEFVPLEPYVRNQYLAPLPILHTLGRPVCEVGSLKELWQFQSLTKQRMKVLHQHSDSAFIAIFKSK